MIRPPALLALERQSLGGPSLSHQKARREAAAHRALLRPKRRLLLSMSQCSCKCNIDPFPSDRSKCKDEHPLGISSLFQERLPRLIRNTCWKVFLTSRCQISTKIKNNHCPRLWWCGRIFIVPSPKTTQVSEACLMSRFLPRGRERLTLPALVCRSMKEFRYAILRGSQVSSSAMTHIIQARTH